MWCLFGAAALLPALALATSANAQVGSAAPAQMRITPVPEPAREGQKGHATIFSMNVPTATRPLARGRTMLFGGWQPNERTMIGVGLFSVPRSEDGERARIAPVKDMHGRSRRVAAIGMSFRF